MQATTTPPPSKRRRPAFLAAALLAPLLHAAPASAQSQACTIPNPTAITNVACAKVHYVNGPYAIHGVGGYYDVQVTVQRLTTGPVGVVQYKGSGNTTWTELVRDSTLNASSVRTTKQVRVVGWLSMRVNHQGSTYRCIDGTCA